MTSTTRAKRDQSCVRKGIRWKTLRPPPDADPQLRAGVNLAGHFGREFEVGGLAVARVEAEPERFRVPRPLADLVRRCEAEHRVADGRGRSVCPDKGLEPEFRLSFD